MPKEDTLRRYSKFKKFESYIADQVSEGSKGEIGALMKGVNRRRGAEWNEAMLRKRHPTIFKDETLDKFGCLSPALREGEWMTYGRTTYYTKEEAERISGEIKGQGIEAKVIRPSREYEQYHVQYLSIDGAHPKGISIE